MPLSSDPIHIAISKSRGLAIDWADGHSSHFPCPLLRDLCPCATCTGAHGTEPQPSNYAQSQPTSGPFPMFKPAIKMLGAEEVGNYAVRFDWNDGHNSGIYSFDYLRGVCPCPQCDDARRKGTLP